VQGNVVGRIIWLEFKRAVPRLLSGLEAGVFGGMAMLALLVSGTLWRGYPWWMPYNLLGSTFYGVRALSAGPSQATLAAGEGPASAFRLAEVAGVAVEPLRAEGRKCARSWRILPEVGSDPRYPDLSLRDADAVAAWDATHKAPTTAGMA